MTAPVFVIPSQMHSLRLSTEVGTRANAIIAAFIQSKWHASPPRSSHIQWTSSVIACLHSSLFLSLL